MVLSSTTQNHYRPNKDPIRTRDLTPGGYADRLARSGSGGGSSSSGDDLRELVRAASSHSSPGASPAGGRTPVVPRSQSAGMARINEDGPCDFGGDAVVVGIIPKSRSCEVPKSRVG
ncbi:hypothetical protein Taro_001503 [Colocasia esculenta]|uniref:Uncharacterized protein n=1 Tax=Colocasia esculenta TaxID=4460 RepID=A0A843TDR8_COLES|nr:hypothetical protein [Colocasia esculenta]